MEDEDIFNKFNIKPLGEVRKILSAAAQGFEATDIVIGS